jgi:glycine/D-amino acid oxidase-like deaminating enzyme
MIDTFAAGNPRDDARTHGLWEASAPHAPRTGPLTESLSADVAIIGGGFTGLSTALHLAEAGVSTVVLEARELGFGGSGRNVGLVNAGMWVMPSVIGRELGDERGERLLELLGNAPSVVFDMIDRHRMACQAVRHGTLHCGVGRAGLAQLTERARQWRARGAPVELLDAKRTQELTGTPAYAAALLDRRAGTIQPLAYTHGLAAAALRAGAHVHTNTRVTSAQDIGAGWRLGTATGATVTAGWVVVASNAYSIEGCPWSTIRDELVALPYFNLATAPLPAELVQSILPERQGAWDTRQVLSSFRLDASGRLIFGSIGALRGNGRRIHRDWGRRALGKLFPQLRDMDFEHEWYGTIGMTANALPRFHELDRQVVSFSGFNGRGIAPGTVFGRELARLILGQTRAADLPLPITPLSAAPLRPLREAGYEIGSQLFHLVDARR